jgi:hypothetical protein
LRLSPAAADPAAAASRAEIAWMAAAVLLAAASRLVYCFHRGLGAGLDHLYDDALITLRYSRNLAEGLGLVYNPGELCLGTSSPLYALLIALPASFGFDPLWSAVSFNIGCDAAVCVLLIYLCRGFPLLQALAPCGYLLHSNILYWSGTGMEFSLLVLLGYATVAAFAAGRHGLAGVLAGLALVGRLDAVIFLAGLGVVALLAALREKRIPWRFPAGFAAASAPWFCFAAMTYGHLVPLSARARYLLYQSQSWGGEAVAVLAGSAWLLPAALGAFFAWHGPALSPRLSFFLRVLSLHPLFFLLAYEASGGRIYRRYQVALDASLVLLGCFALAVLAAELRQAKAGRRLAAAAALFGCAVLLAKPSAVALLYPFRDGGSPGNSVHLRAARWIAESSPPEAVVMAGNIGYLGYFTRRTIFDLNGLVSPRAYEALRRGESRAVLIAAVKPEVVALDPDESALLAPALAENGYHLAEKFRHPELPDLFYRVFSRRPPR